MPSLVRITACRLFGANPLSEQMMVYCQLDPEEYISMKFDLKFKSFNQWNAFEDVSVKMAAISSRPQCVKHVGDIQ